MVPWFIGAAVFVIIGVTFALLSDQVPRLYHHRGCAGRAWRESFPSASKEEIRQFLQVFITSFGFRQKHRLKFLPSDRVMDIYKALYPLKCMPDGFEVEDFAMSLEEKYGFDLASIVTPESWPELTLGMIFQHIKRGPSATEKG